MYELHVKVDAETNVPPDFILYCGANQFLPLIELSNKNVSAKIGEEGIYHLKYFGIKSEATITEYAKLTNNHYQVTLYLRFKLPLFYGTGVGVYHFVREGNKTLCYGGGRENFTGFSGIIVKIFNGKISHHFVNLWAEIIKSCDLLWNDIEIAQKYIPGDILEKMSKRESFDDLLDLKITSQLEDTKREDSGRKDVKILEFLKQNNGVIYAGDLAIFLGVDLKDAKEKLNVFIENGDCKFEETNNLYIFPDFHMEIEKSRNPNIDRLEQRLNCLEDWIKIKLIASQKIIDTDPEMAVVRAGKTAEAIVKDVYIKNFDDDETNVSTMIKKLSEENLIPEHIASWMHTIRSLRNIAVHGDGIDKTQAIDALNASLNVAEWHLDQIKSEKK